MAHFKELDYLEHMSKTRYQLLYKFPLIICIAGSFFFKNLVLRSHANLLKRSFYLRLNTPAKKMHNGLHFGLLILYVGNFASLLMGTLFSGIQYAYGIRNRYLKPISNEQEIRRKYLEDMKAYDRVIRGNPTLHLQ